MAVFMSLIQRPASGDNVFGFFNGKSCPLDIIGEITFKESEVAPTGVIIGIGEFT